MPLSDALAAVVHISRDDPLGDVMKRIRIWLDDQRIQTTTFTTMADASGFTLKIGFLNADDADCFRRQFSNPPSDSALSSVSDPALALPVL